MTFIVALLIIAGITVPVAQQPPSNPVYVGDGVTQYDLARQHGAIGLLAHLEAGQVFLDLRVGDTVTVVDADGVSHAYTVREIVTAQAVRSDDPWSPLLVGGETVTSTQLFYRVYRPGALTLQTCVARDGGTTWGRLFVVAERR